MAGRWVWLCALGLAVALGGCGAEGTPAATAAPSPSAPAGVETPAATPEAAPSPTPAATPEPTRAPTPAPTPEATPETTPDPGPALEFADACFEKAVLAALEMATGEPRDRVYAGDLAGVDSLSLHISPNFAVEVLGYGADFSRPGADGEREEFGGTCFPDTGDYWSLDFILTLEDLRHFPDLRELTLQGVRASDLSPVFELTQLESFSFYDCYFFEDLSGLAGLTKLKKLSLDGWVALPGTGAWNDALLAHGVAETAPFDLAFLPALTELEFLYVSDLELDLSLLSGLTALRALAIDHNLAARTDLSVLAGLEALQYLSLERTDGLCRFDALVGHPALRYLYMRENDVSDAVAAELLPELNREVDWPWINTVPERYLD